MGLEGAESEKGRGHTTRIELKMGPTVKNCTTDDVSLFLLVRVGHIFQCKTIRVFIGERDTQVC